MDLTGQTIGQYRVLDQIGQGGMAVVYRAEQPSISRYVAIKVMPHAIMVDENFRARFEREVRVIASLEHPAILPVFDYGQHEGAPYIVMRYVTGGSLDDAIRASGGAGMDLETVDRLVTRIAAGLDLAHKRGIIHRDYKPSNVLLDEEGFPYLADFGIAKISEGTVSLTGEALIGTPAYMAPEMSSMGGMTPLVDVYALGVSLYQMVTGELPYTGETLLIVLMAHINDPIPDARVSRPDLPDSVQAVIEKSLAKDPAERYQSAGELAESLHAALTTQQKFPTLPPATYPTGATLQDISGPLSAVLTITGGPLDGERIAVVDLPFTIGRAAGSGLTLDDPRVSRQHARLELRADGGLWVLDLGSSNGTFVNGLRIETQTRLTRSDIVSIGDSALQVSLAESVPGTPPPFVPLDSGTVTVPEQRIDRYSAPPATGDDPDRTILPDDTPSLASAPTIPEQLDSATLRDDTPVRLPPRDLPPERAEAATLVDTSPAPSTPSTPLPSTPAAGPDRTPVSAPTPTPATPLYQSPPQQQASIPRPEIAYTQSRQIPRRRERGESKGVGFVVVIFGLLVIVVGIFVMLYISGALDPFLQRQTIIKGLPTPSSDGGGIDLSLMGLFLWESFQEWMDR